MDRQTRDFRHGATEGWIGKRGPRQALDRKALDADAVMNFLPHRNRALAAGPKMFQVPRVGRVEADVLSFVDEAFAQFLEIELRAADEGILAVNDVQAGHAVCSAKSSSGCRAMRRV